MVSYSENDGLIPDVIPDGKKPIGPLPPDFEDYNEESLQSGFLKGDEM